MQVFQRLTAIFLMCFVAAQAQGAEALDPVNAHYVELLSNGGPSSIRQAAQSMHRSGVSDERVLDVAAEVLLRDYRTAASNTEIDALAWVTNALSNAKTDRYNAVLQEVEKNAGHKKLAKYAAKNFNKRLPTGDAYVAGSVKLEEVAKATAAASPMPAAAPQAAGSYHPISVVKVGMSRQEVMALAGPPTATRHYQTGKAFIPFNYRGGDLMREEALYKGQGRIVMSNTNRYSNDWEVLEVIVDGNESGYP
jgi:hypothetical protein